MIRLLKLITLATLFISCASVPMADRSADMEAKLFKAEKNKSVLYIFRNEFLGAALKKSVTVDNVLLGNTGPETFFRYVVKPGKHTIISNGDESKLDITTKRNQIYYIQQEIKMGAFTGSSQLNIWSKDRGQRAVKESKLIKR